MSPTEAFLRAAKRYTLRHKLFGAIGFSVDVVDTADAFRITASAVVPDRETGRSITIYTVMQVGILEVEALDTASAVDDLVLRVIRRTISQLFEHELDEMLCRDGQPVRDPHALSLKVVF